MQKQILIIEDDVDMCIELKEILTELDCSVQTANEGRTGKELIDKNTYDVILLDLKIPEIDGYQLLNFIVKKNIKSKIIVMTARMNIHFEDIVNQTHIKNETILKIANHVLLKPFKIKELLELIG